MKIKKRSGRRGYLGAGPGGFIVGRFYTEAIPGEAFTGYWSGILHKGQATPWFEFDEAIEVLTAAENSGLVFGWEYDQENAEFRYVEDPSQRSTRVVYGRSVPVEDGKIFGFVLGEWGWQSE